MSLQKCYQQNIFYNEVISKNLDYDNFYIFYNKTCVNCFLGSKHYECLSFKDAKECNERTIIGYNYNCYYEGKLPSIKNTKCCQPLLKDLLYNGISYPGLGCPDCSNGCMWSSLCYGYKGYHCYSGETAIICQNANITDGCNIEASVIENTIIHDINCTDNSNVSLKSSVVKSIEVTPTQSISIIPSNNHKNDTNINNVNRKIFLILFMNILLIIFNKI